MSRRKAGRPHAPAQRPRAGPRASRGAPQPAKFVTGSLLRHILVMTGTGAVGLMAIFIGDLANIVFLSLLRDEAVVAAVGYASSILFFTISIGIGLSIAATALVSPALGAGLRVRARRLTVNVHLAALLASSILGFLVWVTVPWLLKLLGAEGHTAELATGYLLILVPALPPLALGMTSAAVLRSVGDARRAMHVTLAGAIVNMVLDPVFIFALGLGIYGAAIASFIARFVVMGIGLYGVVTVHGLMGRPRWRPLLSDLPAIWAIAAPAVLTNVATPVVNAYVTAAIAPFGDSAVAGWAIVGRIMPVAFGAIFALSASVGPIVGQNLGSGSHARMRGTLTLALLVVAGFTGAAWIVLAITAPWLVRAFGASGEAAELILLFCRWLAPLFAFLGALFVANAVFNTLGRAHYSSLLNWGRALATVPFVEAGARIDGSAGVLAATMLAGILVGVIAVMSCYRLIDRKGAEAAIRNAAPRKIAVDGQGSGLQQV